MSHMCPGVSPLKALHFHYGPKSMPVILEHLAFNLMGSKGEEHLSQFSIYWCSLVFVLLYLKETHSWTQDSLFVFWQILEETPVSGLGRGRLFLVLSFLPLLPLRESLYTKPLKISEPIQISFWASDLHSPFIFGLNEPYGPCNTAGSSQTWNLNNQEALFPLCWRFKILD